MAEMRFDGKVALVTGAGRGLGRAYAELLAARGASVVVNDPGVGPGGEGGSAGPADECVAAIRASGGKAVANYASVATAEGAAAMVRQALDDYGQLDILINNAGIPLNRKFEDCSIEDYQLLMNVHFFGTVLVTKAAWPALKKSANGRVVNTTSSTIFGFSGWSTYGAAKGAIFAFTKALATEAAEANINVNAIAPGAGTNMTLAGGLDPERLEWMQKTLPPSAVAPVVAWLAHENCPFQGEILSAAGGRADRYLIGETEGLWSANLTLEEVRDKIDLIMDKSSFAAFGTTEASVARAMELQAAGK